MKSPAPQTLFISLVLIFHGSISANAQVIYDSLLNFDQSLTSPSQVVVDFENIAADQYYTTPVNQNFSAVTYTSFDTDAFVDVLPFTNIAAPQNPGNAFFGTSILSPSSIAFLNYNTDPRAIGFDYWVQGAARISFTQVNSLNDTQTFVTTLAEGQGFVGFIASPGFHVSSTTILDGHSNLSQLGMDNFRSGQIPEASSALLICVSGLVVFTGRKRA